eukprot:TRINITY_DN326_c0_g1_i10.p1 TRINITY_DN326_c0_g1~~TRINITY_DN326_c0_g1_i10.p1  ORF type:complete len:119 (-),score=6.08 TRINITY_DN326_c0_g1_i10:4430-4786(-)
MFPETFCGAHLNDRYSLWDTWMLGVCLWPHVHARLHKVNKQTYPFSPASFPLFSFLALPLYTALKLEDAAVPHLISQFFLESTENRAGKSKEKKLKKSTTAFRLLSPSFSLLKFSSRS